MLWQSIFVKMCQIRISVNKMRILGAVSVVLLLVPMAGASSLQSSASPSAANPASSASSDGSQAASGGPVVMTPTLHESLGSAIEEVSSAVSQIDLDHWKLSRAWKQQLQSDAVSIQQDIATQLQPLFQAAQASPSSLRAQLAVMQNVNALYDVLVRVATASDLAEGKEDSTLLDHAMQQLYAARKNAVEQILRMASSQDQVVIKAQMQQAQAAQKAAEHPNKIIVNNEVGHHVVRHRKPVPSKKPAAKATPPSAGTPASTH